MVKADENIFRIYLDTVRALTELKCYDVYDTLNAFQKKLDRMSQTSVPAERYQRLVKDLLKEDPRKQGRLFMPYGPSE